jgi:hypothetical protein
MIFMWKLISCHECKMSSTWMPLEHVFDVGSVKFKPLMSPQNVILIMNNNILTKG